MVSREVLLARGPNPLSAAFDRSIDTLVGRVRRKLVAWAPQGEAALDMIRTVRNAGYVFVPPVTVRTSGGSAS